MALCSLVVFVISFFFLLFCEILVETFIEFLVCLNRRCILANHKDVESSRGPTSVKGKTDILLKAFPLLTGHVIVVLSTIYDL